MAKYDVLHSCGCTVTHQLVGPTKDRARRAAWLGSLPCRECDNRAAAETAAAKAAALALPALTGSPKQIAWAETIRVAIIEAYGKAAQAMIREVAGLSPVAQAEIGDALALIGSEMRAQTEARHWIDSRDDCQGDIYPADHIIKAIQSRDLAPTAIAEAAAIDAARRAQRAAQQAARQQ